MVLLSKHVPDLAAGISTASRFFVKSSRHSRRSSLQFPAASTRQFPASSLLREFAGFNEVNAQSCKGFSSHLWSDVAFDRWPTASPITRRQECLRATAQSRGDEDRAHVLVLPRSSALLHWPLPPFWGSWTFEEFSQFT